ncbi:hypothetical protein ACTXGJ_09140 [Psychrobacter sp. 1Y11]
MSNSAIFIFIALIFIIKVVIYIFVQNDLVDVVLGGGSDANYYNSYAVGVYTSAVNIWPEILRYLSDRDLYSRKGISYMLFVLNLLIIPFIVTRLAGLKFKDNQKYFLYSLLLCFLYPTAYYFTFDIYRDIFMVFVFLTGCLVVKAFLNTSSIITLILTFICSLLVGLLLLELRPYLGYAFILSLFLWKIKYTKNRLLFFSVFYLIGLFIANYVGVLDLLTEYRSGFEDFASGSTLGLDFSNPMLFVPNFILSILGQLFGLYITNPAAVVLFIIETLPFLFMLIYVIRNIKLADNFIRFLVIFFVIYASVWLIGNDNLGTAVRLRMYNYFAVYISFFYILRLKTKKLKHSKVI